MSLGAAELRRATDPPPAARSLAWRHVRVRRRARRGRRVGPPAPAARRLPQRPGAGPRARGVGTAASVVLYRITGWGEGAPWWGSVLWVAAMNLPLAARRRWPEIVALVASAAFIVGAVPRSARRCSRNICPVHRDLHGGRVGPEPTAGERRARRDRRRHVRVAVLGAHRTARPCPDQLPDLSREGASRRTSRSASSTCSRTCCTSAAPGTSATRRTARLDRAPSSSSAPPSSPPSASAPARRRSRSNGCASRASCTTSSPTMSR